MRNPLLDEAVRLFADAKHTAAIVVLLQYADALKSDERAIDALCREYNVVRRERQWLYSAREILRYRERFDSLPRPARIFAPVEGTHAVRTMQPGEMALWRGSFAPIVADTNADGDFAPIEPEL